jgi:hypothetical protein
MMKKLLKTIGAIMLYILAFIALMVMLNYSMELASSKSKFALLGWTGFAFSIYGSWIIISRLIKETVTEIEEIVKEKSKDPANKPNNKPSWNKPTKI